MLNLLRVVEAPNEFRFVGSWVSGRLLDQVADYQTMVDTARRHIESMEQASLAELDIQRTSVLKEAAQSCRDDLIRIAHAFDQRRSELEACMADACIEVTRLAIDEMVRSIPQEQRIEALVSSLLASVKSRVNLIIRANPEQVDLVKQTVAAKFAEKLGLTSWAVHGDFSVKLDRFVVDSDGESYIDVSLENWLNLMAQEVESLRTYFDSQLTSNAHSVQGQS